MTPAGVVLDLDGVLLAAGAPIPGAAAAVRALQAAGHPCAVLTNMTSARPEELSARLADVGIDLPPSGSSPPPSRPPRCCGRPMPDARILLWRSGEASASSPAAGSSPARPPTSSSSGGPDDSWTLSLLDEALRALQGGARLIAMQGNAWWLAADGPRLDSGSYVRALAYATGVRPRVIGKPSPAIFRTACRSLGLPPAACIMVGDDLRSDVLAAQRAGLRGVLVRTGKGASFADDPRAAQAGRDPRQRRRPATLALRS